MTLKTLLILGRVSNLPTIWTNVLAATLLAQASTLAPASAFLFNDGDVLLYCGTLLALSMMYTGGMFLNDAFDASWDRKNNPTRPIAAGAVSERTVWFTGGGLILLATAMTGTLYQSSSGQPFTGWLAAGLLASAIVAYNALHKQFAHSAFLMGACRSGVYLISALLLSQLTVHVMLAALSLLLYIAGLTYVARQEHNNKITRFGPLLLLFSPVMVALLWGYKTHYFWLYLTGVPVMDHQSVTLCTFHKTTQC